MLHIHRAERADGLIQALTALLLDPLDDPFAQEVVAVPTRGMERWLTQRMSECLGATPGHSDGVCANVDFPSPRRLVNDAVAAASGIEPGEDPWLPERAVWSLLEVVDECVAQRFHLSRVMLVCDAPEQLADIASKSQLVPDLSGREIRVRLLTRPCQPLASLQPHGLELLLAR